MGLAWATVRSCPLTPRNMRPDFLGTHMLRLANAGGTSGVPSSFCGSRAGLAAAISRPSASGARTGQVRRVYSHTVVRTDTRPEWQIVDLAAQAYSKVSVSLYDTLGPDAVGGSRIYRTLDFADVYFGIRIHVRSLGPLGPLERTDQRAFSCNHAEISIVFVGAVHLTSVLALAPRIKLKVVVSFDEPNKDTRHVVSAWAKHRGIEFFSLNERKPSAVRFDYQLTAVCSVEALGNANLREPIPPAPEQVYSICYTSVRLLYIIDVLSYVERFPGYYGRSQRFLSFCIVENLNAEDNASGVVLSHGQAAMAVCSAVRGSPWSEPGILLSYLPLAHIYGVRVFFPSASLLSFHSCVDGTSASPSLVLSIWEAQLATLQATR